MQFVAYVKHWFSLRRIIRWWNLGWLRCLPVERGCCYLSNTFFLLFHTCSTHHSVRILNMHALNYQGNVHKNPCSISGEYLLEDMGQEDHLNTTKLGGHYILLIKTVFCAHAVYNAHHHDSRKPFVATDNHFGVSPTHVYALNWG